MLTCESNTKHGILLMEQSRILNELEDTFSLFVTSYGVQYSAQLGYCIIICNQIIHNFLNSFHNSFLNAIPSLVLCTSVSIMNCSKKTPSRESAGYSDSVKNNSTKIISLSFISISAPSAVSCAPLPPLLFPSQLLSLACQAASSHKLPLISN